GDRSQPGSVSVFPTSRRALRRDRPDRGPRHPADRAPAGHFRHRRSHHGSQRPRDFVHRRSGLYNPRGRDPSLGHASCTVERRRRPEDLSRREFSASLRGPDVPMALEQKLNLRLSQRLVMTPSLQQAIKLLQMSRLELQEVLNQEMVENPILEEQEEMAEAERTEATRETEEAPAPAEAAPAAEEKDRDSFEEIDFNSYFEDYLDSAYNPRQYQEQPEEFSLENVLTRPEGLPEYLTWQLSMSDAPPGVRDIAAYLIGNIDEDGYLRVSREEIREAHFENDGDVEAAL